MFVLPTGSVDKRQPWIFLSFIVAPLDEEAPTPLSADEPDNNMEEEASKTIHDSYRRDVCINLNVDLFVGLLGYLEQKPYKCDLNYFFEINRNSGYTPVVLPSSILFAQIALLPSRKGVDACILKIPFTATLSSISDSKEHSKMCFMTPDSFSTNANFPLRNSWSDMQREMFLGVEKMSSGIAMTRQGTIVLAHRIVAQNSISPFDTSSDVSVKGNSLRMQVRVCVCVCVSGVL
jgi:hypothetical protein